MQFRDHTFLGMTQSLCPDCLGLLPAKIIARDGRVYFRKRCSEHGLREDFVCSDVRWFDRLEYSTPGKLPLLGVEPRLGCPYDCGLCTEHEQHTCVALLEITSSCNLSCPVCFAESGPGGEHLSVAACQTAIDRLVEVEGQPEVLQLSGGEPTVHPDFLQILEYACEQPIDYVMINTNGIRIARDPEFVDQLVRWKKRIEVYFQFDGFRESVNLQLRGESLQETKLRALENLAAAGIHTTLVCTLQPGVNDDQMGDLVRFALRRPHVTGLSFQPATYSGRYFLPEDLEQRITFPDVIRGVTTQASELFQESDFLPLPCAHPNGHTLSFAYRHGNDALPLNRFIDIEGNIDLLANGITFTRERARQLIETYLARGPADECRASQGCGPMVQLPKHPSERQLAETFFQRALEQTLDPQDLLRVTVTSFMDAYNFDVRQVMKSCVHHILPSGHIIPFSAYNVLYRHGHVPLPQLTHPVACETPL